MTREERPTVTVVYFATTSAATSALKDDEKITVSVMQPAPDASWNVLYEIHPRASDLTECGEGRFEMQWGKARSAPHRTSTR